MKSQMYSSNIKFLINSNFLFLESLSSSSNKSKERSTISKLRFLSISEYVKGIKQLIRALQFLRNQSNSFLYLERADECFDEMVSEIIKKRKSKISFKFFNKFLFDPKREDRGKKSRFYLHTNQNSFTNDYFKFLFFHRFYMISSINSNFDKRNSGVYKLYSDLVEIKKQLFFLLILKKNI